MTVALPTRLLTRPFVLYLFGLSSTSLADAVLSVGLPFAVLANGGKAAQLALVALCASLPRFAALLLGALADRFPVRPLLLTAALLRTLLVLGVGGYALSGGRGVAVFAGFALLNGVLVTLTIAASNIMVPRLVAEAHRSQGNSLVNGVSQGLPLVGYGLGGLLVHWIGSGPTLLIAAPLYAVLAVLAPMLPLVVGNASSGRQWSLLRDLAEGWKLMRLQRLLLFNLLLTFTLNLILNILNVRSPLFAREMGRGAVDYALLESLFSGGALVGIVGIGLLSRTPRVHWSVALGLGIFTVGMLGHGIPQLLAWFVASAVTGLGVGLLDVASMTQMQRLVPDGLRGRVTGISMSTAACGLSLGAVVGGLNWSTAPVMLALGGVLLLLTASYLVISRPTRLATVPGQP
ncbi:MFS transporter [Deinococcus sp. UYEF24]